MLCKISHLHLELTHADSGSWTRLPFLVLKGGGGCCNHRFSLCICRFSSCCAPPHQGGIRGSLHSHAGSTGNRFLMMCLLPPCQKTPCSVILACEHGRCPGMERACAHSSRPQSCAWSTQRQFTALFAESKLHTAVPRWPWCHHVETTESACS